jgi:hypothetical protein
MRQDMRVAAPAVARHFAGKSESVQAVYERLLQVAAGFGTYAEDPKKTSIHLSRRTAFAGVATRKDALLLTIKSAQDIQSPRIHQHEQVSAHRWHLVIRLATPADIDAELVQWLQAAYELAA